MAPLNGENNASLDQVLRGNPGIVSSIAFHPTNEVGSLQDTRDDHGTAGDEIPGCDDGGSARKRKCNYARHSCQQIASSSSDGTVMIFNIHGNSSQGGNNKTSSSPTRKKDHGKVRAYRYIGHRGPVHRIAYSPSGKVLASCSSDNTVRLWNPSRNYSKGDSVVLKGHNGPVRCVDFGRLSTGSLCGHSNDDDGIGSLLLTGSDDKTVKLWAPKKATNNLPSFVTSFVGHTNWVRAAKFCQPSSSDGNDVDVSCNLTSLAASGGDDKTVRIWSCERAVNLATYSYYSSKSVGNNGGGVRDLDFLPSGMSLAACGTDGYTRLFDLRSDAVVQNLDCNNDSSSSSLSTVDCLSIHPDGIHLMCSTSDSARDGRVQMFDLRSPAKPTWSIPSINSIGRAGGMNNVRPNSSSQQQQSSAALTRSRRPSSTGSVLGGSIPTSVTFSPDGLRFATSLKENAVRLYHWNSGMPTDATNNDDRDGTNAQQSIATVGRSRSSQPNQAEREIVTRDLARALEEDDFVNGDCPRERSPPKDGCNFGSATRLTSSPKYNKDDLPEILSSTLDGMVGQLELLAQTIIMMERRLAIQESAMDQMQLRHREISGICNDGVIGCSEKVRKVERLLHQQEQPNPRPQPYVKPHVLPKPKDSKPVSKPSLAEEEEEVMSQLTDDMMSSRVDQKLQSIMARYSMLPQEKEPTG